MLTTSFKDQFIPPSFHKSNRFLDYDKEFMSAAARLLKDPSDSVRLVAAIQIMELYPEEAEALDVYKKFPQLLPLRPQTAPP
jgi:hypothetical protein